MKLYHLHIFKSQYVVGVNQHYFVFVLAVTYVCE